MSNVFKKVFGKKEKAPPPSKIDESAAVKEITDVSEDRQRILTELRKRRQISVLNRNREEPNILKRKLGGG